MLGQADGLEGTHLLLTRSGRLKSGFCGCWCLDARVDCVRVGQNIAAGGDFGEETSHLPQSRVPIVAGRFLGLGWRRSMLTLVQRLGFEIRLHVLKHHD